MSVQPQALDRRAEDHVPRTGPIFPLANDLLRVLGPDWSWDDSVQVGVNLVYKSGVYTVHIEDAGFGFVRVAPVMPQPFMPEICAHVAFDDGPEAVAHEITGPLLTQYRAITNVAVDEVDQDAQWEKEIDEAFREYVTIVGPFVSGATDRVTEPALRKSAWFKRRVGDSLRIEAAPGDGACLDIYVPDVAEAERFVRLWADLPREKTE